MRCVVVSQNGWSAGNLAVIDRGFNFKGATFPGGVRSGDVEKVLGYVVAQLDARVEKVHPGWCWGYFYRQVRGASSVSNHSSGTAVDYNAPAHPMGSNAHAGFSTQQVAEIHKILAECSGVVRWGGDYTSARKDPMHFEIVGSPAAVAAAATRLGRGSSGAAKAPVVHPSVVAAGNVEEYMTIKDLPAAPNGGNKVLAVHPHVHWQMTIAPGDGSFELQHVRNWTANEGHGSGGDLALDIHTQEGETFTIPPNTQKVQLFYTSTDEASVMVHPLPAS